MSTQPGELHLAIGLKDLEHPANPVTETVTPNRLRFIAEKGACTHLDLQNEPWRFDFTRATDRVAQALGVTDKMPCVVVIDFMHASQMELLEIPRSFGDLVGAIRSIVASFTGPREHQLATGLLERLHEAHDEEERVLSLVHARTRAVEALRQPEGNLAKKLRRMLAVPRVNVESILTPERIQALRELRRPGPSAERIAELFGVLGVEVRTVENKSLSESLLEIASVDIVERILPADALDQQRMEVGRRVEHLREELTAAGVPSLCSIVRDVARQRKLKTMTRHLAQGASELAKPSVWLELIGLFTK